MKTITAYIIAGGKSSRMGTDKGLLPLNRKPIVSHIYETLVSIFDINVIVVSSDKKYDFLGCDRIEDVIKDKGPVGGIYSALLHSKTKLNFIVSVDVPLISVDLIQWIIDNHKEEFQLTQVEADGKSSPLIAVYDKSLELIFKENLEQDQLRLRNVIESIKHQTLQVPEKWKFQIQNINTKEEYQRIIQ
jgi:molybdopterin-guanine dinucleotide biosynthesis protein A